MIKIIRNAILLSAVCSTANASTIEPHQLFSKPDVADMTLYVFPSEWNEMLSHFNTNPDDGEYVSLDKVEYKDSSNKLDLSGSKLSIKGDTSRVCPERGDAGCGPHKTSYGTFVQANMKVKFKELDCTLNVYFDSKMYLIRC